MDPLAPTPSASCANAAGHHDPVATKSQRQVIAEALQQLHAESQQQREREAQVREQQGEFTKSVVKIMHLDSTDYDKIIAHTQNVTQQNAIAAILDRMRALEVAYQLAKKELASINDKKLRHERVQLEKRRRDDALGPLRTRLQQLDPSIRPGSSFRDNDEDSSKKKGVSSATTQMLPSISGNNSQRKRGTSPPNYREAMEAVRKLQKERKAMADPYQANLKLARLWRSINDHERALEDYEKASRSLTEKQIARIPLDERAEVLERERPRRREAFRFLFMKALQLKEREEAAELMTKYLDLSTASERPKTVAYLEGILRKQGYIEDETLTTPEAVTQSILCTNSLGFLSDLRFQLLQEMLEALPNDAFLLDAVENMHVRRRAYEPAKQLSDRFVKLPEVKCCSLFASFAEFQCSGGRLPEK
ncbi:Piezo-type mechanosensitive ion channel component 2 [Globisporangium polare]